MEIIGIDGYFILNGGQLVSSTNAMRNKRAVVDALRHITFVTRQQYHMVKIQITCFENAHHLNTLCRFTMERNGGLLYQLVG